METKDDQARSATGPAQLPLRTGRWVLDPTHSSVSFSIRHLGLSRVRGQFSRFDAWLDVGSSAETSRVEATIDVGSIDTNQAERDEHLRSPDFLDAAGHPEIRFVSTGITEAGETWRVDGELTLLGRTHPFGFDVEFHGARAPAESGIPDLEGYRALHAGFSAAGEIKRSEVGLDFGIPAAQNILLGETVKFELDLELVEPST